MKLIEAQISDFKAVQFAHIRLDPKAGLVEIAGENGSGKSSIISGIMSALEGMANAPVEPVRRGAKRASTELKFDTGLVVKRTIQATGGTILTVSRDGMKYSKPQEVIDEFFGRLAFDPYSFSKQKPKEQLQTLMQLVGLDFTEDDKLRAEAMDERKQLNKTVEKLKLKIQGMPYHPDAPDKEHSVADLNSELQRLNTINAELGLKAATADRLKNDIELADSAMQYASGEEKRQCEQLHSDLSVVDEELRRQIETLQFNAAKKKQTMLDRHKASVADLQRKWAAAQVKKQAAEKNLKTSSEYKVIDTSELQQQIALAEIVNKKVADNARRAEVLAELAEVQQNIEGLTDQIKSVDEHKRQCVAECQFPVAGLSLTDDGVTLNGMPYSNTCESEQIRASVLIGKATNPKMSLMFVREGGAFTDKGMKLLAQIAEENDLQLMVERPGVGGESAIVISEGRVVGAELELPED